MIIQDSYWKALDEDQLKLIKDIAESLEQDHQVENEQALRRTQIKKDVSTAIGQGISVTFLSNELGLSRSRLYQMKNKADQKNE